MEKRRTNYEGGIQMRNANQMSYEYRDSKALQMQMQSSEHGTAYLRGASIGDSDGKANVGVGLSYFKQQKQLDNIISGTTAGANEIHISNQQEDGPQEMNSDLPKISSNYRK